MSIVIWFTGLSGSGKTTIAKALKKELEANGTKVDILDGDMIRATLHKHLGFSREDIRENNRLIAELACQKMSTTDVILVPIISPYQEDRMIARSLIGESFIELFLNCPLGKCIDRDPKGLYKKALAGEIEGFIGLSKSNPYEPPLSPEIEIMTSNSNIDNCVKTILDFLK